MCQTINTAMILGYILSSRKEISYSKLADIKTQIHRISEDIFVDISEAELYRVAQDYPMRFLIKIDKRTLVIHVKKKFNISYLDECYQSSFSKKDFTKIKKILLASDE